MVVQYNRSNDWLRNSMLKNERKLLKAHLFTSYVFGQPYQLLLISSESLCLFVRKHHVDLIQWEYARWNDWTNFQKDLKINVFFETWRNFESVPTIAISDRVSMPLSEKNWGSCLSNWKKYIYHAKLDARKS